MAIDNGYICASDLELFLIDKTTGLPLTAGTITFYSDNNRATLKPIFTISGTSPNYSFVQLPNPSTLSGTGTFQDASGNNVVPYYYPYDADGNLELYYVVVNDMNGVQQLTREAWPPSAVQSSGGQADANAINYIPNGQFLSHNNIPADIINNIPFGQITQAITPIAQGGWYFERPVGSTSIDNIQFFTYPEFVLNPSSSPRNAVQLVCSAPSSVDSFKDIRIRFMDVNKFASDTDEYTYGFYANTLNSGNFNVNINVIKYFGTGGSPSSTLVTTVGQFLITSVTQLFQLPIIFGSNTGYNIGTNGDDYVEIAVSFPTNISFGSQLTDFMLFYGSIVLEGFPPTTDNDFLSRSLVPIVPSSDGSNLFLKLILTPEGLGYDMSEIGRIEGNMYDFSGSISTTSNLIKCDGSQYLASGYSPLGIPYARLANVLYNSTVNQYIFGTGLYFVHTYIQQASSSNIYFSTNISGAANPPADGSSSTNFNFFTINNYAPNSYGFNCYLSGASTFTAISFYANTSQATPTAGTSGFAINVLRNGPTANFLTFTVTTIAASTLASKYFLFYSPSTSYYMWFTVDGAGSDPTPGGTGIKVNLKSSYTALDVCNIVSDVLHSNQTSVVTTNAASSINAGSYFTFTTYNANSFFVWYKINGMGSPPSVSGLGIPVNILSSDSASQVALKTSIAINKTYFSVPFLQGSFLRGYDPTLFWDTDASSRCGLSPNIYGNMLGTFEIDQLISHVHTFIQGTSNLFTGYASLQVNTANTPPVNTNYSGLINATGGSETRPVNQYVNWMIRY